MVDTGMAFLTKLQIVVDNDVKVLHEKGAAYGDSWKKRGGIGAFMMLARKWDRIENISKDKFGYDIIRACLEDTSTEGMLEQVGDLRRYLALIEAEVMVLKQIKQKEDTLDFSKGPRNIPVSPTIITIKDIADIMNGTPPAPLKDNLNCGGGSKQPSSFDSQDGGESDIARW